MKDETHEAESMSYFEKMSLVALSAYIDKMTQRCEYINSELAETQKLAAYASNPRYIFSFSFPPLYLIPTPKHRNQIDSILNKTQIKYHDARSHMLEANVVLNARVEKVLMTFSEFYNNPLDRDLKDRINKMNQIERKEFVEYLHYQKYTLKKECQRQGQTLATLQKSSERFFERPYNQIHLASFHLAQARSSLKKIKKLEAFVEKSQRTLVKAFKGGTERKEALWSAKGRTSQPVFTEHASKPSPPPPSGPKKRLT